MLVFSVEADLFLESQNPFDPRLRKCQTEYLSKQLATEQGSVASDSGERGLLIGRVFGEGARGGKL